MKLETEYLTEEICFENRLITLISTNLSSRVVVRDILRFETLSDRFYKPLYRIWRPEEVDAIKFKILSGVENKSQNLSVLAETPEAGSRVQLKLNINELMWRRGKVTAGESHCNHLMIHNSLWEDELKTLIL